MTELSAEQLASSMEEASWAMREATKELGTLQARNKTLADALERMVKAHDDLLGDTEGRFPPADHGCIECTLGTVPNRLNTGLCAYHAAKRLLARERARS